MTEPKAPFQRAWILIRGQQRAECSVGLDGDVWEVRFAVDGVLIGSKRCPTQEAMLVEVGQGERNHKALGWVEGTARSTNGSVA